MSLSCGQMLKVECCHGGFPKRSESGDCIRFTERGGMLSSATLLLNACIPTLSYFPL